MSKTLRTALSAAGLFAGGALGYATLVEPYALETVYLDLVCPRLPPEFDGYTLLHLSDLHMRQLGRRERILERILQNLPEPDAVLINGDLVHTPRGIVPFLELARSIHGKDGVFVTFGNSEHKNGVRSDQFADVLADHGMRPLINTSAKIERGDKVVYLVGVDDPVSEHDDLAAAMTGVPREAFQIIMMHSPDTVALACAYGSDVVFSGHTHGGQVKLPLIGAPYTHSRLGRSMSHGLYAGRALRGIIGFRPGRTQLYVTRGIGISGLALRFLCRPELTYITLRRPGSS